MNTIDEARKILAGCLFIPRRNLWRQTVCPVFHWQSRILHQEGHPVRVVSLDVPSTV
ncbi:MAG: hypothetical protein ACRDD3_12460 [Azovibrio sp.]